MTRSIYGYVIALLLTLTSLGYSNVVYQTGFEPANEPFGPFTPGKIAKQNDWGGDAAGQVTAQNGRASSTALTLGPGSGRYGKFVARPLGPSTDDQQWLSLWIDARTDRTTAGYSGFVILEANHRDKLDQQGRAIYLLVYQNALVLTQRDKPDQRFKTTLNDDWHHIEAHLRYDDQAVDLYLDGEAVLKNVPFRDTGDVPLNQPVKLVIGGAASTDATTRFDDLYLGSEREQPTPDDSQALKNDDPTPFAAIPSVKTAPIIDGQLNDDVWKRASFLGPFFLNNASAFPSQRTWARAAYDQTHLYLAFECEDMHLDPVMNKLHEIIAQRTDRDTAVWTDDAVEIFIAPNPDALDRYAHIAINSIGTVYDAMLPEPGTDWNPDIQVGTSRDDKRWVVELAIPASAFEQSTLTEGQQWRMNLCREQQSQKELSCWSPTQASFHSPNRFGTIMFADKVPPVRLTNTSLPADNGTHKLQFAATSPHDGLDITTQLQYSDEDRITTAVRTDASRPITSPYIVFANTPDRQGVREVALRYAMRTSQTGELLYRSPLIHRPRPDESPFVTRFVTTTSRIFIHDVKELNLAAGGYQHLSILSQSSLERGEGDTWDFVFELPDGVKLIDPTAADRRVANPLQMTSQPVQHDGQAYRQWRLIFPNAYLYPKGQVASYENLLEIFLVTDLIPESVEDRVAYFWSETTKDGKLQREPTRRIPLRVWPKLAARMPEHLRLIDWSAPMHRTLNRLSAEEQKTIFQTSARAGFNFYGLDPFGEQIFTDTQLQTARDAGLKLMAGLPVNMARTWQPRHFPNAPAFLEKHPQFKAVTATGEIQDDLVCKTHLLDPSGAYRPLFTEWLSGMAQQYAALSFDHEINPTRSSSICYCDRCIQVFNKELELTTTATREQVLQAHRQHWLDFQVKRSGQLAKLMSEIIHAANPECQLSVYSGYQSQQSIEHYGMDWHTLAPYIDFAMCGYGRPLAEMKDTLDALDGKPLVPGELILVWNDMGYNFANLRTNLFRRLLDGSDGLMAFFDFQVDARFWHTMADIASLTHDYEPVFLSRRQGDDHIKIHSDHNVDQVISLRDADHLVIVLINAQPQSTEFALQLKDIPSNWVAADYFGNRLLGKQRSLHLPVAAHDVQVIVLSEAPHSRHLPFKELTSPRR